MSKTHRDVLNYWFKSGKLVTAPYDPRWMSKSETVDAEIRQIFKTTWKLLATDSEARAAWRDYGFEGHLGVIIVLDQFSRNMFRGKPEAFKYDYIALETTRMVINKGLDKMWLEDNNLTETPGTQWALAFTYMPFMHSESQAVHEEALKVFDNIHTPIGFKYEKQHKDVIDKFGRYPHRNAAMGRESTAEEIEFMKTHSGW